MDVYTVSFRLFGGQWIRRDFADLNSADKAFTELIRDGAAQVELYWRMNRLNRYVHPEGVQLPCEV